ncbi:atrial natriuretic peptide receptor 1-like [Stylophora pistillata]|uniref:Guanylate cyclase n=1 Tax=Stylophora pistillata TaxID=50429 RepID=A0A2B4SS02_STYPI|nr:atrial natriuretic peptide receptor 1-like [Stylophora pistillata]PFX31873.1 Speract receptor [Stylophora pistillata]
MQTLFGCLQQFLLILAVTSPVFGDNFTLGLLVPLTNPKGSFKGKLFAPAIASAVDDVNNSSDLLAGHHLSYIWNDTECKETKSLQALSHLINERKVSAIIGPGCSCQYEARYASAVDVPMISYMCNEPLTALLEKEKYATFAETVIKVEGHKLARGLIKLFQKFHWSEVAILYENATSYVNMKKVVVREFTSNGINVLTEKELLSDACYSFVKNNLSSCCDPPTRVTNVGDYMGNVFKELKSKCRILLYLSEFPVARQTLEYAHNQNMTQGDYAFVMLQLDLNQFKRNMDSPGQIYLILDLDKNKTCDYYEALESVVLVEVESELPDEQKSYKAFEKQVKEKYDSFKTNLTASLTEEEKTNPLSFHAYYLYDAVYQYAKALNKTLARGDDLTGKNIMRNLMNSTYKSKLGPSVFINENGSADVVNLRIVDIRWNKSVAPTKDCLYNNSGPIAKELGRINFSEEDTGIVVRTEEFQWPNGKGIPLSKPKCGFDGLECVTSTLSTAQYDRQDKGNAAVIAGVSAFAAITCIILLVNVIRQYMLKKEGDSLLWKMNYKDIRWVQTSSSVSSDMAEEEESLSMSRRTSNQFTFTNFGFYKENRVTVKQIGTKTIDLTKSILLELKQMRDFRHENFVQFYGATVDSPYICIVSAFFPRTLKEFLACSDVKLDKTFISSLVTDIVKGMAYLHSSDLKYHGSLKSSNCLIDSRWTLKISDYGLTMLRSKCNLSAKTGSEDLLWTAPELLRKHFSFPNSASRKKDRSYVNIQKADVYSFAIILQEFHTRKGPFSNNRNLCVKEILGRITEPEVPIFRPTVHNFIEEMEELRDLMKNCWEEDPDSRPDFTEIKKRINRILVAKGIKTNIFDSMIYMMENYANNLEDIVSERTSQLIEAKIETEDLLYKIFPRPVAEQLIKGKQVEAENFDEVSIYFSDIVGFTELSSESSPMQVVTLLNDLYTLFDDIISEYRVYKVETIGDAYMVVSGLPIKNGHDHAGEISRMALHLLDSVKEDFIVRHKPGYKLQLRIGIHSGPVVAGVVGSTMPRYCLFGDTVNTASRMESNGEAGMIHISEATKNVLEKLGGFTIRQRGEVHLKGKGQVTTYWLMEHKHRRQPTSPKRLRPKRHLFNSTSEGEGLKPCFITRSSSLRRSLKAASENPMTKIPIQVVDNGNKREKRKESTHSITSV